MGLFDFFKKKNIKPGLIEKRHDKHPGNKIIESHHGSPHNNPYFPFVIVIDS